MGMLDRYKKKGGFNQLLQLLETSPSAKREQFLSLIGGEKSCMGRDSSTESINNQSSLWMGSAVLG